VAIVYKNKILNRLYRSGKNVSRRCALSAVIVSKKLSNNFILCLIYNQVSAEESNYVHVFIDRYLAIPVRL